MQYVPFRILRPVGIDNILEVEKEGDVQYEDRCNVVGTLQAIPDKASLRCGTGAGERPEVHDDTTPCELFLCEETR